MAELLAEERNEGEICKAEMQLTKASNCLQFADEIAARPRREWFAAGQKDAVAKPAKPSADGKATAVKRGAYDGLSRHKKRLKQSREHDKKEMAAQKSAARVSKKSARPGKIAKFNAAPPGKKGGAAGKKGKKGKVSFDTEIKKRA